MSFAPRYVVLRSYRLPRGICYVCRRELALTKDGNIRCHIPSLGEMSPDGTNVGSGYGYCAGSWRPPAAVVTKPDYMEE